MLRTVRGTYKDGKVTLASPPAGIGEARVLVTFLKRRPRRHAAAGSNPATSALPGPGMITYGMFKTDRPVDEADFRAAEWRDDAGAGDGD